MNEDLKIVRNPIPGYEYEFGNPPTSEFLSRISYEKELELFWGRRWGAQSKIGKLRYAMVTRPTKNEVSPECKYDPIFFDYIDGLPNFKKMIKEYEDFINILKNNGVELEYWDLPDIVYGPYVRMRAIWPPASAFIINGGAIIPRYRYAIYKLGHEVLISKKLGEIGCPILLTIHGNGIAELGGNGFWLDPKTLLLGVGPTLNLEAVRQMEPLIKDVGAEEIHLCYFTNAEHLDMVFALVDAWLAVLDRRKIDHETLRYLQNKGIKWIEAPPDECDKGVCNLLALEPRKIIMNDNCPKTLELLKKENIECITSSFKEYNKAGGGPHCALSALIRDPGPLLK